MRYKATAYSTGKEVKALRSITFEAPTKEKAVKVATHKLNAGTVGVQYA